MHGKNGSIATTQKGRLPRLGFIGLGWIGRDRLIRLREADAAHVAAVCDVDPEAVRRVVQEVPQARACDDVDALLDQELDGVVVATPNALHAEQTIAALERGLPVFCQKPLGRDAQEVTRMVQAAADADRHLDVDLTYRSSRGIQSMWAAIARGDIGRVYRMHLVFHNGYGPDKAWFYDLARSGGGCILDLGVHLVDLAIHAPGTREVTDVRSRRWDRGAAIDGTAPETGTIEDDAAVDLVFDDGTHAHIACSWRAPMGCDAVMEATYVGTDGALRLRNLDGSFWRLTAERLHGTKRTELVTADEAWRGRAVCAWADRLVHDRAFDPSTWSHVRTARVLDAAMGRGRYVSERSAMAREVTA